MRRVSGGGFSANERTGIASNREPIELELEPSATGGELVSDISLRVNVYYLPDYYADNRNAGRSDPGVPRRKVGTLNDTDDLRAAVRQFAKIPGRLCATSCTTLYFKGYLL